MFWCEFGNCLLNVLYRYSLISIGRVVDTADDKRLVGGDLTRTHAAEMVRVVYVDRHEALRSDEVRIQTPPPILLFLLEK